MAQIARPHNDFSGLPRSLSQSSESHFVNKEFMKNSLTMAVGTTLLLCSGFALARSGNMMNGGAWGGGWMGGYGGIWMPILIAVVVVALVVWVVKQKK